MESFFSDLKKAREAKRLSLSDISDVTRIDAQYLEKIERGQTTILPEPYVRAFIRAYANAIGLDPNETMRRYDRALAESAPQESPVQPAPNEVPPPVAPEAIAHERRPIRSNTARVAIVAIAAVTVGIALWNLSHKDTQPVVQEVPFQNVIKENQARESSDSSAFAGLAPPDISLATHDSLTLRATATEPVWLELARDDLTSRQYYLKPGTSMIWRAKDKFTLMLGNAGGVEFTLNEKRMGTLGASKAVVRNVVFSRQSLK